MTVIKRRPPVESIMPGKERTRIEKGYILFQDREQGHEKLDVPAYAASRGARLDGILGRDHRKLLAVDGEYASTGGVCIADGWLVTSPDTGLPYRDTAVSVTVARVVPTLVQKGAVPTQRHEHAIAVAASGALLGASLLGARFPRLVAWPLTAVGAFLGVLRAVQFALSDGGPDRSVSDAT